MLFGIFRYLYLVHQREEGGNPTQLLLTDRPLLVDVVLWIAHRVAGAVLALMPTQRAVPRRARATSPGATS